MARNTELRKLLFLAGPGDCVAAAGHWSQGMPTPGQSFQTYTAETLNFVRDTGAAAWIISSNARRDDVVLESGVRVSNVPRRQWLNGRGAWFHLGELWYALTIVFMVRRFRADAVVVDSGTFHWFLCWLFRAQGTRVYASFHNSIFPAGNPPRAPVKRAVLWMNAHFLRHGCSGAMFVSPECERQFVQISGRPLASAQYLGTYDPVPYEIPCLSNYGNDVGSGA